MLPDRRELHLSHDLDDAKVGVEDRGVVELCPVRRHVDVDDRALGVPQLSGHLAECRGQLLLGLLAVAVPRRDVRVPPADHLVALVEHHDPPLRVRPPRRCVEQRPQRYRIVVAEHEEQRGSGRAEPVVGEREPGVQPLLHQGREQGLEAAVGHECLDLAGLRPVGVVAVVLDQPLERLEVGALLDAVVDTDEATSPAAVGLPHDRLDRLARDVAAENEDIGAVDRRCVDELAETLRRTVEVRREQDPGRPGHSPSGAGRDR